uniref:CSON001910 protein n=1 Tax=Culicoides sonorensis TaxID=179676 RepID=A0A336KZ56_CULSO
MTMSNLILWQLFVSHHSRVVSTGTNSSPQAARQSQPAQVISTVLMTCVQMIPIVSMTTDQQPTIIGIRRSKAKIRCDIWDIDIEKERDRTYEPQNKDLCYMALRAFKP